MGKKSEIELKLNIGPSSSERIKSLDWMLGGLIETDRLKASYFDTPDHAVRKAGFSFRIREEGKRCLQTVKFQRTASAGLFERTEWEHPVKGNKPDLTVIAAPLVEAIGQPALNTLEKIFVIDVQRTRRVIDQGDMSIEFVIDEGQIRARTRHATLIEVELELLDGSPQSLFDFARRLNEDVAVRLGVLSKAERGYNLIEARNEKSFKAEPILLDPTRSVGDAFVTIAQSCIHQFRRNEDVLLDHGGAAALHQARVGIRRLRSAFSLFKPLIEADERAELLRLELRQLGATLGTVRNLDVLIPRVGDDQVERLTTERAKAMELVHNQLCSCRTRLLMIDLIEWLTIGDWRTVPANSELLNKKISVFADGVLERYRRRLKRRGKNLSALNDEDRHQVRIEAKKLRYATEFFASLYDGKQARKRSTFLDALEQMQDHLGELNDLATGPELLSSLGVSTDMPVTRLRTREHLLDRSEDAFDKLIEAKRFWR